MLSSANGPSTGIQNYLQVPRPEYFYSQKMTLKQYLEAKNVQRRLQYRLINIQRNNPSSSPLKQEKQYYFQKQVHDIKGFIKHIIGEGSLYNKFQAMMDNLYVLFMKEITVYHKLKVERQQKTEDQRLKEFRQANNKLAAYLKTCQDEEKQVQDRLQHMKKARQFYKKQRQNQLKQVQEKMNRQKLTGSSKKQRKEKTKQSESLKGKQGQNLRGSNPEDSIRSTLQLKVTANEIRETLAKKDDKGVQKQNLDKALSLEPSVMMNKPPQLAKEPATLNPGTVSRPPQKPQQKAQQKLASTHTPSPLLSRPAPTLNVRQSAFLTAMKSSQMRASQQLAPNVPKIPKIQQPPEMTQKQRQEYEKRKQNIGKLSNVFASFINPG